MTAQRWGWLALVTVLSVAYLVAVPTGLVGEQDRLSVQETGLVVTILLTGLAADGPASVRFGEIFVGELTRLDAIGFIRPRDLRGLNAIRTDRGSGLEDFDLKDYVEITQEGRDYLEREPGRQAGAVRRAPGRPGPWLPSTVSG